MHKLLVVLAGPIVNILLVVFFLLLPEFRHKSTCIYTNLLIGIFNLIPIYPLDGGRALESVLKKFLTYNLTDEWIHKVSNTCLVILSLIGIIGFIYLKNIALIAIITYLWVIVILENKKYRIKQRIYKYLKREA